MNPQAREGGAGRSRGSSLKVSLAQLSSRIGDVQSNEREHAAILDKLGGEKTDVVAFPELSLTGYMLKDLAYEARESARPR